MPIHRHLDEELVLLRQLITDMFAIVDEQFANGITSLLNGDVEMAEKVVARDDEVDELELQIDEQCERVLALYHPVAQELRMLITAVKINTDLERIGDHCKNLAKNTRHVDRAPDLLQSTHISDMTMHARAMLRNVQDAFFERDRVGAREVLAQDKQVDRLHEENFADLVRFGREHPDQMEAVAHLVTASKALERISDHAKNIAESVVFLVEGKDIRHRKLQRS